MPVKKKKKRPVSLWLKVVPGKYSFPSTCPAGRTTFRILEKAVRSREEGRYKWLKVSRAQRKFPMKGVRERRGLTAPAPWGGRSPGALIPAGTAGLSWEKGGAQSPSGLSNTRQH